MTPAERAEGEKTAAERARRLVREFPSANSLLGHQVDAIAAAITEAEQRGAEQMRERVVKMADTAAAAAILLADATDDQKRRFAVESTVTVLRALADDVRAITIPAPDALADGRGK